MDKSTKQEDIVLICIDCSNQFIFSAGEQAFYRSKALSVPKRCPTCRQKRKANLVPDETQLRSYREVGKMLPGNGPCNEYQEGNSDDK
jgi:hypothetical protein